jgi:hypothetical protein
MVVGEPEGKRALGIPNHIWEFYIKVSVERCRLDSSGSV